MKASELRIGNLVFENGIDYDQEGIKFHDPLGDEVIIIRGVETFDNSDEGACVYHDGAERPMSLEDISPIPLTEEWLLKFGFSGNQFLSHPNMIFSIQKYSNMFVMCLSEHDEDDLEIKYVHQLQNLYFALTGEELTNLKS